MLMTPLSQHRTKFASRPLSRESRPGPAGFSLPEMLIVVALIGIFSMMGMAGWQEARKRAQVTQAAQREPDHHDHRDHDVDPHVRFPEAHPDGVARR